MAYKAPKPRATRKSKIQTRVKKIKKDALAEIASAAKKRESTPYWEKGLTTKTAAAAKKAAAKKRAKTPYQERGLTAETAGKYVVGTALGRQRRAVKKKNGTAKKRATAKKKNGTAKKKNGPAAKKAAVSSAAKSVRGLAKTDARLRKGDAAIAALKKITDTAKRRKAKQVAKNKMSSGRKTTSRLRRRGALGARRGKR